MKIKHTAGSWDPKAWPIYFAASNVDRLRVASPCTKHVLVAVNELDAPRDQQAVYDFVKAGKSVLVDSGVYNLATEHAIAHDLSMDQALGLAPAQVDGFDALFERYTKLIKDMGDKVWGYIEIDQGGRENKIKTRARLEKMGFAPMPVYHPFNDGWEYFDYLAQRYDRICFGNIVQADSNARKRLIATAWERRRKYPNLWIHALGMTPSATTTAFPMNSCDSSTWILSLRWSDYRFMSIGAGNDTQGMLEVEFRYDQEVAADHARGNQKATRMCAYDATMVARTMRNFVDDQRRELGADPGMFK